MRNSQKIESVAGLKERVNVQSIEDYNGYHTIVIYADDSSITIDATGTAFITISKDIKNKDEFIEKLVYDLTAIEYTVEEETNDDDPSTYLVPKHDDSLDANLQKINYMIHDDMIMLTLNLTPQYEFVEKMPLIAYEAAIEQALQMKYYSLMMFEPSYEISCRLGGLCEFTRDDILSIELNYLIFGNLEYMIPFYRMEVVMPFDQHVMSDPEFIYQTILIYVPAVDYGRL